ncbi:conjugal transfer relaxosome DNA-binding protein TraM [Citrobacter braakii]|uniref:conjugal transfer relaxosome DNA-binding protein TraM n=1 Tax=Citrobacter braakii TaxID=57706 RepID=UPI00351CBF5A
MARIQVYVNDEVAEKINAIAARRRAEGAREKDVSSSSIGSMLLELGLRVYEAQMERKESPFNQTVYNKMLLENVLKTQLAVAKVLGISSLSPHIKDIERFKYQVMVDEILEKVEGELDLLFPSEVEE